MNAGFAVAAATVALSDRLHVLIGDAVPGARVTTLNPGDESLRSGDPIVNLFLFRSARNGFVSNNDLPTRSAAGQPLASPVMRLDLDYMISFFGNNTKLDPQRLLGLVVGGLNAEPYIKRNALRATIATTPWLGGSPDPELPMEEIRVTPLNMPPDAMARLWSEFVHVPYQLTQLYTVTSVPLVTMLPVEPVLPVRRIGLRAVPSRRIVITSIVNAADPELPLQGGGQMASTLDQSGPARSRGQAERRCRARRKGRLRCRRFRGIAGRSDRQPVACGDGGPPLGAGDAHGPGEQAGGELANLPHLDRAFFRATACGRERPAPGDDDIAGAGQVQRPGAAVSARRTPAARAKHPVCRGPRRRPISLRRSVACPPANIWSASRSRCRDVARLLGRSLHRPGGRRAGSELRHGHGHAARRTISECVEPGVAAAGKLCAAARALRRGADVGRCARRARFASQGIGARRDGGLVQSEPIRSRGGGACGRYRDFTRFYPNLRSGTGRPGDAVSDGTTGACGFRLARRCVAGRVRAVLAVAVLPADHHRADAHVEPAATAIGHSKRGAFIPDRSARDRRGGLRPDPRGRGRAATAVGHGARKAARSFRHEQRHDDPPDLGADPGARSASVRGF